MSKKLSLRERLIRIQGMQQGIERQLIRGETLTDVVFRVLDPDENGRDALETLIGEHEEHIRSMLSDIAIEVHLALDD